MKDVHFVTGEENLQKHQWNIWFGRNDDDKLIRPTCDQLLSLICIFNKNLMSRSSAILFTKSCNSLQNWVMTNWLIFRDRLMAKLCRWPMLIINIFYNCLCLKTKLIRRQTTTCVVLIGTKYRGSKGSLLFPLDFESRRIAVIELSNSAYYEQNCK